MKIELSGAMWRKSIRSATGDCVEVADNLDGVVGVRNSKNVNGPVLAFESYAWGAFVSATKADALSR